MRFGIGRGVVPAKIESRVIDEICRMYPRWKQDILSEIERISAGNDTSEYERITIMLDVMTDMSEKSYFEQQLELHGFQGLMKKMKKSENSPQVAFFLFIFVIIIIVGLYAYYLFLR